MKTKICFTCKEEKLATEFHTNKAKQDGLEYDCKVCRNKRDRNYYKNNPTNKKQKSMKNYINNGTYVFDYLRNHPCVDCGESNPVVLQFDHVKGNKKANLTILIHSGANLTMIQEEIEKCQVRCANCHHLKTAREQNWYKYIPDIKQFI